MSSIAERASRRRFLEFLAASPLWSGPLWGAGRSAAAQARTAPPDPMVWAPRDLDALIADPKDALSVFDFEPVMRNTVPPAHFGYMATGAEDEATLRANRAGFGKFQLRARRLVDVSQVDMRVEIFGTTYDSPIAIAPTGSNKAFHPEGERAVARAARAGNHLQMLSTVASTSIEDAIAARGAPVWFQLYTTERWEIAEALVARAEAAGAPVIAVTVDVLGPLDWETYARLRRTDARQCSACHHGGYLASKPNFSGIDVTGVPGTDSPNLTWERVKRLRDKVKVKLVLKGILAAEDATLAAQAGVDGVIVSNHGGRVEAGGRSTIEALPEILAAAGGRMPVLVDSGFRRGTDIVKALALGATAVAVGRPYLWGLGAFGQPGVERVLELLRAETRAAMRQCGARSLKALTSDLVRRA
ncbi:MAG TPA: alpha-hydroxy acid oxidase [Candidatus Sulfotelmatobacter sp.]|nr:alpha-hydroxy acid oxidase [Candidatus Sulfotelmatobacter sp.]